MVCVWGNDLSFSETFFQNKTGYNQWNFNFMWYTVYSKSKIYAISIEQLLLLDFKNNLEFKWKKKEFKKRRHCDSTVHQLLRFLLQITVHLKALTSC